MNDPTSTALTAETLEAQERSGPLDQLQAREFSDRVPRKVFDGTMFSSLHPASSVHMLRELPPVSREQLEGIMHALGHLETEHKCSYLRMDDDDCSSQFDKALEVAAPNNSIFSIAKEQMGLPTIVGRREVSHYFFKKIFFKKKVKFYSHSPSKGHGRLCSGRR